MFHQLLTPVGNSLTLSFLIAALPVPITCVLFRVSPAAFAGCVARTVRQVGLAVITVILIMALAYLMNYSGIAYTLGLGAASTGRLFILCSPFLGWIAVALSGSDASGNALFGNLQVIAAKQLNFSPILVAATNSSGGVMGKMISPQNLAAGAAVTQLKGQDGHLKRSVQCACSLSITFCA